MAYIQDGCSNKKCSYCELKNDNSTYNFDPDYCYMSGEEDSAWKYYNTSLEEFINMFHGENSENLISECNKVCDKFMDEVSNNNVQDTTCDELNRLYGYGCYISQFINNIRGKNTKLITTIIESGSVRTFYKYFNYFKLYDYYLIIRDLYLNNRYDILNASKNEEYKSIGFYNIIRDNLYLVFREFVKANRSISAELKEHLINTFGEEFIVDMFTNLSAEAIERNLSENFPAPSVNLDNLDNLPTRLTTLTCSENKITTLDFNKIDFKSVEIIHIPPSYIVKENTIESVKTFIDNEDTFKNLDLFVDNPNAKEIISKVYSDSKTGMLHNMSHFYPEMFSSVQQKITERYLA